MLGWGGMSKRSYQDERAVANLARACVVSQDFLSRIKVGTGQRCVIMGSGDDSFSSAGGDDAEVNSGWRRQTVRPLQSPLRHFDLRPESPIESLAILPPRRHALLRQTNALRSGTNACAWPLLRFPIDGRMPACMAPGNAKGLRGGMRQTCCNHLHHRLWKYCRLGMAFRATHGSELHRAPASLATNRRATIAGRSSGGCLKRRPR